MGAHGTGYRDAGADGRKQKKRCPGLQWNPGHREGTTIECESCCGATFGAVFRAGGLRPAVLTHRLR